MGEVARDHASCWHWKVFATYQLAAADEMERGRLETQRCATKCQSEAAFAPRPDTGL